MQIGYTRIIASFCLTILLLSSCKKEDNSNSSCEKIAAVRIKPLDAITKGDPFVLTASTVDANYLWNGPNYFQSYHQLNSISYATYENMGWYYLSVYIDGCTTKFDSIYVKVNIPQGAPACSLTDNVVDFSSLRDQTFSGYGCTRSFSGGQYELEGSSNGLAGDIGIIFSPYWFDNGEPEDGMYTTTNDQLVDYENIDEIFIYDINTGMRFVADAGSPVYISHTPAGKLVVSFCDINFRGNNGSYSFQSKGSGRIIEQ